MAVKIKIKANNDIKTLNRYFGTVSSRRRKTYKQKGKITIKRGS